MKKITALSLVFLSAHLLIYAQTEVFISEKLEKLWTVQGLNVPESVLPVPEEGIMYVSNIGTTDPSEKAGKGFISILTMEGKIKKLAWSTGLNSPKGMAISNDKLYVSEVDRIAEIELPSGKKLNEYVVEGAKFLNDIAADEDGNLYISDSQTNTVHKLSNGVLSVFARSENFTGPNGVLIFGNALFLGSGNDIVKFDLETRDTEVYFSNTGGVDGIALIDEETVVFSDWPGIIHVMKKNGEKQLIYDSSSSATSKTADFGYYSDRQLLYLPTFFQNTVICFRLKLD